MDLVDYVDEQLASVQPFRSKAATDHLCEECDRLLTDPVVISDSASTRELMNLRAAAQPICQANSRTRPTVASGPLVAANAVLSQTLSGGAYLRGLVDRLEYQICDGPDSDASYSNLRWGAEALISALRSVGFSIERIESLANDLAYVPAKKEETPTWRFATKVLQADFLMGVRFDRPSYNLALQAEIDAFGPRERLEWLATIPVSEPLRNVRVVALISGMRTIQDLQVGKVLFYRPHVGKARFVSCEWSPIRDDEVLGEPDRTNATVVVQARDYGAAVTTAIEEISGALDVIGIEVSSRHQPLNVNSGRMICIDEEGHLRSAVSALDTTSERHQRYFALDIDKMSAVFPAHLAKRAARIETSATIRDGVNLRNAVRALRRSYDAPIAEDRVLNAWQAAEALLGDEAEIKIVSGALDLTAAERRIAEVVASVMVERLRSEVALQAHKSVEEAVLTQRLNPHLPRSVDARDVFIDSLAFGPPALGARLIATLVDDVRSIRPHLKTRSLLGEIDEALAFYSDAQVALLKIGAVYEGVRSEVTLIYQLRNRWVHQAKRRSEVMRYFAGRSQQYATALIEILVQNEATKSHSQILQAVIDSRLLLLQKLSNGSVADLLA